MNLESEFIKNSKPGDMMFTEKNDANIQALASYYKVKVVTERLVCLDKATTSKITNLLKITKI